MRWVKVAVVIGCMACTGRIAPSDDAGTGPMDAMVDAGSADIGAPHDAGSCVDVVDPCQDGELNSQENPCLPWETECRRVKTCAADEAHFCRQATSCLAIPTCGRGESQLQVGCGLDEPDCRVESLCGSTVFCRPNANCDAVPTCPPDRLTTTVPCGEGEPDCVGIYECGQAFWCRVDPGCDGTPTCIRGVATAFPCAPDESFCERVTTCGASVFCRY